MAVSLDPAAILSQLTEGYIKLPFIQKIIFPVLFVGSVMGLVFVSRWASQPEYSVLYSDLNPADAAAVVQHLKQQKIKYEVRGDGSTVAISPPDIIPELRIAMASEGIPKSGSVGLEIFDVPNLSSTSVQEKNKQKRANQGELERTIGALDAVSSVRVHITTPERTIFAKNSVPVTASVLLKLRPGAELTKKQVKGIGHLVAGSVEGLKPENVTIIDVYGNLLSPHEEEAEALGIEATRLQYQHELEQGYVQRIEQMLSKVVGVNSVIARVTAELDFSTNEREEESYDPGGQVVRSERSIEEGVGDSQRGGVPGVVSNLSNDPNLLAPQGSAQQERSLRKEALKNYEVSRAVTKTTSPRGKLQRLSVAVLVDGIYESAPTDAADAKKEEQKTPAVFKPLEPEVLSRIESIAKSAVGFDSARGDTLTVENIQFRAPDTALAEVFEKTAWWDYLPKLRYLPPTLFILLFFMVFVRPLVKFLITPTEAEVDLGRLLPSGIAELEQEMAAEKEKAKVPTFEPAIDMAQLEEMMAENSKIVKENPQQAALLIRYWLNDGRL